MYRSKGSVTREWNEKKHTERDSNGVEFAETNRGGEGSTAEKGQVLSLRANSSFLFGD